MAAPPPSALASRRLSPRAGAFLIGLGILLAELVVALGVVDDDLRPLLLPFLAAGAMALVFTFPLPTALLLLALAASILQGKELPVSLGPLEPRLYEPVLGALVLAALVRPRRNTFGGTPGAALLGFLALLALAAVLGLLSGRGIPEFVFSWTRPFEALLFFYVVVRLFPDRRSAVKLLTGAAVLAAITGVVALAVSVGPSALGPALASTDLNTVKVEEEVGSFRRVRLPGLALAYALFWVAVLRTTDARGARKLLWAMVLGGISLNIALSLNRNMWIGLLFGLVLLLVVSSTRVRHRLLTGVALGATAIAMLLAIQGGSAVAPIAQRGATLLDPETVTESSSLRQRFNEHTVGWQSVKEHPLIGIGPGSPYGRFFMERRPNGRYERAVQRHLHNQYLYLTVIAGVPAMLLFVVFLVSTVRAAWTRGRGDPLVIACGVGLAMVMLSALVELYFSTTEWTLTIALLAGAIFSLTRHGAGPEPDDRGAGGRLKEEVA